MKKYLAITAALALALTACGQAAAVDVDGGKADHGIEKR